jgi:hypothetical protein
MGVQFLLGPYLGDGKESPKNSKDKMNETEWRDLEFLQNPVLRTEKDLDSIVELVDNRNFPWGSMFSGIYCETGSAGLYWILKSLSESAGITPDKKICDIGFGSGTVLATFALLGYKTY